MKTCKFESPYFCCCRSRTNKKCLQEMFAKVLSFVAVFSVLFITNLADCASGGRYRGTHPSYKQKSFTTNSSSSSSSSLSNSNSNFNPNDFALTFSTTTQVNVSVRTGSAQSAGTDAQVYIDFELLPLIVATVPSPVQQPSQKKSGGVATKRNSSPISSATTAVCGRTGHQWGLCMSNLQHNVSVIGSSGASSLSSSSARRDTFEPNNVDTFTLNCPALSDIRRVRLFNFGNDGWLVSDLNITYAPISIPTAALDQRPLNNDTRKQSSGGATTNSVRRRSAAINANQRFVFLRFACNMWLDPDSVEHNKRGYGDCRLVSSSSSSSPFSVTGENPNIATEKLIFPSVSPSITTTPTSTSNAPSNFGPTANPTSVAETPDHTPTSSVGSSFVTLHNTLQAWVDFNHAVTNNNATASPNDVNVFDDVYNGSSTETSEASAIQPPTGGPKLAPSTPSTFPKQSSTPVSTTSTPRK